MNKPAYKYEGKPQLAWEKRAFDLPAEQVPKLLPHNCCDDGMAFIPFKKSILLGWCKVEQEGWQTPFNCLVYAAGDKKIAEHVYAGGDEEFFTAISFAFGFLMRDEISPDKSSGESILRLLVEKSAEFIGDPKQNVPIKKK